MSADRIAQLEARVAELERIIAGFRAVFGGGDDVADDEELDDKFGDPLIKKDPTERFWRGPGFVGKHLSECPPEYLDAFGKYKDLCAKLKEKDGTEAKRKYAEYDRADARMARGWSRRIRAGWKPPERPTPSFGGRTNGVAPSPFANGATRTDGNPFASRAAPTPADAGRAAGPPTTTAPGADDGTDFDFGFNTAADDDDEELPL